MAKEPADFEDLRRLPGDRGRIMRAALGASAEELAHVIEQEMAAQAQQQPGVFVNKYAPGRKAKAKAKAKAKPKTKTKTKRSRPMKRPENAPLANGGGRSLDRRAYANPFAPPGAAHPASPPNCITVAQFGELYAAAEFAAYWGLWLDVSVTITWRLLGVHDEAQMQVAFGAFMKCLRSWLAERHIPQAWIFVHERGRKRGLHTHLAVHIPGTPSPGQPPIWRRQFRSWVLAWAQRFAGRAAPYSIRVRDNGGRVEPFLHWLNFNYLVKGHDREAVVQSARNSPSRRDVMLGDLIAFAWENPGVIACKRAGAAQDLGPAQRKLGYPPYAAYRMRPQGIPYIDISEPTAAPRINPRRSDHKGHEIPIPFRSKFEDGARSVTQLYPSDFVEVVRDGHSTLTQRAAQVRAEQGERQRQAARDEEALREDQEINAQWASLDI